MGNDSLGDRMKMYEKRYSDSLMPLIPAFARIDGKNFHAFTKGLEVPYDKRLSKCMTMLTEALVKEFNAVIGYTQSDEITLSWNITDYRTEMVFGGKVNKLNSLIAAYASVQFQVLIRELIPEKNGSFPLFDCRVWNVPTLAEAVNVFLWREQDAIRNSVQMAARSVYSHKQCDNKDISQLYHMLLHKGIDWDNYPTMFKRGTYIENKKLDIITDKFESTVVRKFGVLEIPPLNMLANKAECLYGCSPPLMRESVSHA